jgi:hypothetical protein
MKKENIRILLKCYKYCERSKGENLKRVKKNGLPSTFVATRNRQKKIIIT